MQLFNIGTHLLNEDGTLQRDPETGNDIEAYSTLDIMSFARAWTGFDLQKERGNFEANRDPIGGMNVIDPMHIVPEWRDKFPKTNLIGGKRVHETLLMYLHLNCASTNLALR